MNTTDWKKLTPLHQDCLRELEAVQVTTQDRDRRVALIDALKHGSPDQLPWTRDDVLEAISSSGGRYTKPLSGALQAIYGIITTRLAKKHPEVLRRTRSELRLESMIRRNTALIPYRSVWIGNVNIDLFLPGLGGDHSGPASRHPHSRAARGIALEVNGPVHDLELKMRKDTHKEALLDSLGIALLTIENPALYTAWAYQLIKSLARLPKLSERIGKQLWRRIWLETVYRHAFDHEFMMLFGFNPTLVHLILSGNPRRGANANPQERHTISRSEKFLSFECVSDSKVTSKYGDDRTEPVQGGSDA